MALPPPPPPNHRLRRLRRRGRRIAAPDRRSPDQILRLISVVVVAALSRDQGVPDRGSEPPLLRARRVLPGMAFQASVGGVRGGARVCGASLCELAQRSGELPRAAIAEPHERLHRAVPRAVRGSGSSHARLLLDQVSEVEAEGDHGVRRG